MRHLFLALMIALLPLRGWVGDVMAAQMTSTALSQSATASHHGMADAASQTMVEPSDCPGHHAATADESVSDQAECSTCTVCQICHSVALTPLVPHLPSAMLPGGQVQTSHVHFASAERAPGFKPPIF